MVFRDEQSHRGGKSQTFEVSGFWPRCSAGQRIDSLEFTHERLCQEKTMSETINIVEAVAPVKKAKRIWQFSVRGLLILMLSLIHI